MIELERNAGGAGGVENYCENDLASDVSMNDFFLESHCGFEKDDDWLDSGDETADSAAVRDSGTS